MEDDHMQREKCAVCRFLTKREREREGERHGFQEAPVEESWAFFQTQLKFVGRMLL